MKIFLALALLAFVPVTRAVTPAGLEEGYYEAQGVADAEAIADYYPDWQTNFWDKIVAEDTIEEFIVSYRVAYLGGDPFSTEMSDAFIDGLYLWVQVMNTTPGTGGAVPGTSVLYVVVTPDDPPAIVQPRSVRQRPVGLPDRR